MIYTYNITDFLNDKVDLYNLTETINDANLPLKHIVLGDTDCYIHMLLELTTEQKTLLDSIIAMHDGNNIVEEEVVSIIRVKEEEEIGKTNGHFQSYVIDIDINKSGTTYVDKVFPFNISLFSSEWLVSDLHVGDIAEFHLAPDTPVGVLTVSIPSGTTVLNVNNTIIENVDVGYFIKIGNDDLGWCIAKDTENMTITVENPTTIEHNAMDYILMTIKVVPRWKFTATGYCSVGESKIGASYIPANTPLRLVYHCINGIDEKTFGISIDYLY